MMSQIRTGDKKVIHSVGTDALPVGIGNDAATHSVRLCRCTESVVIFRRV